MKIKEKLGMDRAGLTQNGPINIVIFGDSVSHGALNGNYDYEGVYWNLLKKRLNALRDYVPVNMINASIGGTSASQSVARLDSQVLKHEPDLIIVCFGLNDVNGTLDAYLGALSEIFRRSRESGAEVIFMTPNMLNTYVAEDTPKQYYDYAHKTAKMQNEGRMDEFIYSAVKLAADMGIPVCDCYSKWKKISETEDTTMLLVNRINHPTSAMHELFANALYDMIIGKAATSTDSDDAMVSVK